MKDRVPAYPGRVTLTPIAGQRYTYDMARADEPIEPGDALNKANLLPDDVAQALGLTQENPQVKDALATLDSHKCVVGTYTGDGATTDREINLGFKPELVILYANPNDKYYSYTTFLMLLNDNKAGYAGYLWQSDNGFTIGSSGSSANIAWNRDGSTYSFAAWR